MHEPIPADLLEAGWQPVEDGRAMAKSYTFPGFPEAMAFMLRVSYAAQAADHHPEWSNIYDRVVVRLTTHDTGGLTAKDIALARVMESAA
jgi:4a-hydroxytetrahydrobiopterin dehydratase